MYTSTNKALVRHSKATRKKFSNGLAFSFFFVLLLFSIMSNGDKISIKSVKEKQVVSTTKQVEKKELVTAPIIEIAEKPVELTDSQIEDRIYPPPETLRSASSKVDKPHTYNTNNQQESSQAEEEDTAIGNIIWPPLT